MTTFLEKSDTHSPDPRPVPEGHVRLTIDGEEVDAPKGELLIRACERLGIIVPRFCDHPLLDPAGACRQCLVEVEMGEGGLGARDVGHGQAILSSAGAGRAPRRASSSA